MDGMVLMKYGNRNVPKMIGQVETLRQIIRAEGTPAVQDAWDKVEEHIDYAYRADLDQAPAPVRVRKLEWEETETVGYLVGKPAIGSAYVAQHIGGRNPLWFNRGVVGRHFSPTLEAAKAAAQADYEARVLAALEAPDAGVVAELVEAAKRVLSPLDGPCRYDHHGYCQEHFIEGDCSVAALHAALAKLEVR